MATTLFLFEQLHAELTRSIAACRAKTGKSAVHAVRTGTRRMEALLHKLLEDHPHATILHREARPALRTLGKIRKLAGPVRDSDVQRSLASDLCKKLLPSIPSGQRKDVRNEEAALDKSLRRDRDKASAKLRKGLKSHEVALERAIEHISGQLQQLAGPAPSPLATATAWVRRARSTLHPLHEENLHDFRKQTKAARYLAELQDDSKAGHRFAAHLHSVQDAIGQWHDWQLLAGHARDVLGKQSTLMAASAAACQRALTPALRLARKPLPK